TGLGARPAAPHASSWRTASESPSSPTSVRRPDCAATRASAAAMLVLPVPPLPVTSRRRRDRSAASFPVTCAAQATGAPRRRTRRGSLRPGQHDRPVRELRDTLPRRGRAHSREGGARALLALPPPLSHHALVRHDLEPELRARC